MNKLFTKIATVCVGLTMAIGVGVAAGVSGVGEAKAETALAATFTCGEDGEASHADGSSKTSYEETIGDYTLSCTDCDKFFTGARDATGNGCFKFGTGTVVGKMTIAVPSDVVLVKIYVGGYKGNSSKISINGGDAQTITTLSNNGEYTAVEINTTTSKSVSFTTVTGGLRAMVNTIEFYINGGSSEKDNTSVTITNAKPLALKITDSPVQLNATTEPSGLALTYTSSNTSVVSVSNSGLVTPEGLGSATITVAFAGNDNYNSSSDTIAVNVTMDEPAHVKGKTISQIVSEITTADTTTPIAIYEIEGYVTAWYSSNTDGTQYGNFYIADVKDDTTNHAYVYGANYNNFPSWDGAKYTFANDKSFLTNEVTSKIEIGSKIKASFMAWMFVGKTGKTFEFSGAITEVVEDKAQLSSIALSGTYQTAFKVGDTFNYSGLLVTASYTSGDPKVVTPTSVSSPDMSSAGQKTVTVSYTEGDVTKTAEYTITVTAPEVVTIHFMDGEEDKPQECTIGQTIKIPSATSVAPEGYAFDHWVCKEDDKSYKPGDDYTVTGEAHFTIVNHQTAWTKEQSDSFKAVLDGVVPPFISPELVSFTFKEADHAAYAMSTTDYSEAFWSALSTWSDDTYQSVSAKSIETANGKVYASVVKGATFIYGFHFVENTPAPTDWDETTKGLMSEQLHGFVPPYFGEPAYAPTILENFVCFYLEGDRTEDVQKYFVDEKWVEDGTAYRLDIEGGYLIGSFYVDEGETAMMFSFTAVTPIDPTATDWTDGQKAAFAEKLDEAVPPFLGAEFSTMAYDASEGAFKAVAEGDFKAAIKAIFEKEENKDWDLSYYDGYNQAALETEYGYVVVEVDVAEGYTTVYIFFEQTEWYPEELEQFKFAERLDGVVIPYDYYVGNMSWNEEAGCYAFSYIGDYKAKFVSYFEKYFKAYPGEEDVYYVETEHGKIYGQVYNQTYQGKVATVAMIYYVETLLPTTLVVDTTNAKTEYMTGDELDLSGVVVSLLDQHDNPYFDGNPDVSSYCTFDVDLSKEGKATVTVTFDYDSEEGHIHVVGSYDVNVTKAPAPTSEDFAKAVLAQMNKICVNYDGKKNNSKALTAAWAELSLLYSQIEDETERGKIISAKGNVKGSELEQAMAFYDYVCKKYGLNAFVKGRSSKALVTEKVSETSIVPIIAIVVASVTAVTAIGVIVACKRRKNYLLK